ncbi:MAG: hypothetical protein C0623_07550 [Desulfuromonas sp.]|nr:MAG: hypothetical protein C0623_07550 [Desulfuromonas sp.]
MTVSIKNILVAKDLSEDSSDVIRYALELGAKFQAQVHVLHVMPTVDPAVLNMVALSMGADKLAEFNKKNEAEMVEKTHAQLRQVTALEAELIEEEMSRPPKVEACHGEPVSKILEVADRISADMIVLGSHSKGKLHYAFLGSVAEKILHKTHRTVVIIPPLKK